MNLQENLDINNSRGKIILFVGAMNSGKTEKAIRWAQNIKHHTDCNVLAFKPDADVRSPADRIVANTVEGKLFFAATTISSSNPKEAIEIVEKNPEFVDVVIFDEVNFFDASIIAVFEELKTGRGNKKRVIVATGLDKNFRGEPFEPVPQVIAKADFVEMHEAYCKHLLFDSNRDPYQCKKPAAFTQRLVLDEESGFHYDFYDKNNNRVIGKYRPANYYDKTIIVETEKNLMKQEQVYYISVCSNCFTIPGRDETLAVYDFIKNGEGRFLEEILKEFPSANTERILSFLLEEKRVVVSENVFFPKEYIFDMKLGAYVPKDP